MPTQIFLNETIKLAKVGKKELNNNGKFVICYLFCTSKMDIKGM
jgi:hypothetical protein